MEPYPIACFGCHIDRKSSMHDLTYVKRQTRKRMKQLEIHRWVRSIFCIALFLSWIPFLQAQEKRLIDLELNEVPLSTALRQLEREGGKNILFVNDEVEAYRVTVRIQKQPLAEAIQLVLKDKPFICLERQDYFVVQRMDKNKKVEYIRGKVVNEQGKPIPYANVLVLQAGDSTFVNGCVTEDDGTFLLPDPYTDHYLLRVTYVGYQSQTVTCMAENYLQMRPQENQLKEVTVTATRPLVERKNGAYLTHITGTPLSLMGSAADMIGHLPFVTGSDGNYSVIGRGTPEIYINGRKVRDTSELSRLQANEILSAEIITTPGARYASDVKAVIRIRTIRQRGQGLSGSFYADYNQGHAGKGNEGITLNYRTGGLDIFAKTYFRESNSYSTNQTITQMQTSSLWESHSDQKTTGRDNYFNGEIGLNYELNEYQSFGVRYAPEQNIGEYQNTALSSTDMYRDGILVDQLESDARNTGKKGLEHAVNAYYTGTFGKWDIDFNADFYQGRNRNEQIVLNNGETDATSTNRIKNRLVAAKLIATTSVWKGNLSFGTEETWTDRRDRFEQDGFSADADDHIQQTIASAFADYSLELGTFSLQAGLRYEYQKTHYYEAGIFQPSQSPDYHHVLPVISVSYRKGDWNAGLGFKLNKINPDYTMLSSAISYINKYQYSNGNPHLVPQIHRNLSLDGGWKWINISLFYDHTLDMYTSYLKPYHDETHPGVSLHTKASIPHTYAYGGGIYANPKIGCWQPNISTYVFWFHSDARSLGIEQFWNEPQFSFRLDNNFLLPQGWYINLTGSINTQAKQSYAIFNRQGRVDLRISKTFLPDQSLQISLAGYDLFRTAKRTRFEHIYGDRTNTYADGYMDSQRIGVRVSYKFNATKSKYKGSGAGQSEKSRL